MLMQKQDNKKHGFTLIELMVVITVMGIISAVAVPNIFGMVEKSREKVDLLKLYYLREALNRALIEDESALFNSAFVKTGDKAQENLEKLKKALKSESGVQLFIVEVRPDLPTNVQGKHSSVTANSEMSSLVGNSGTWYNALKESGFNGVADILIARTNNDWKKDGETYYSVPYNNNSDYRTFPKEPMFISRELNKGKSSGLDGITSQGSGSKANKTNYRLTMSVQWSGRNEHSHSVEVALLPNGGKLSTANGEGSALLSEHGVCFSTYGEKGCARIFTKTTFCPSL